MMNQNNSTNRTCLKKIEFLQRNEIEFSEGSVTVL